MEFNDIVKIGLPSFVLALISSVVAYYIGRRSKIDDLKIKKGFELIEDISNLFHDIAGSEEFFYDFYERNYGHMPDIGQAIDNFERQKLLFKQDYEHIEDLGKKRNELYNKLRVGVLYLNNNILEKMREYLDIGLFSYCHDCANFINEYYLEFFKNIIDRNNHEKRVILQKSILKDMKNLLK